MIKFSAPRLSLVLALLGGIPAAAAGQITDPSSADNTGYGSTSAEFLLLGASARGTALGGAFAAIATDVSALYYNPAGVALMPRAGLTLGTFNYVANTRYSWGGLAFPMSGGQRAMGIQLGNFGFADQQIYTEDQPNGTGSTYSVSQTFVGLTYAENFSDRFSAGITAKYVDDRLGSVSGKAFAVDFGTNFHATLNNHAVKFSFLLANLGSNLKYSGSGLLGDVPRDPVEGQDPIATLPQQATLDNKDFPLPTTFRVGLAYEILTQPSNRLTLIGDFNQPNNTKPGAAVGAEWNVAPVSSANVNFAVRGSYSYQGGNNTDLTNPLSKTGLSDRENLQGLAFGGGLAYTTGGNFTLGVDYAWKHMGVLGSANFLSLTVGW